MFVQNDVCGQQRNSKGNKRRERVSLARVMAQELKSLGYCQVAAARNLQALGLSVSRRDLVSVFST